MTRKTKVGATRRITIHDVAKETGFAVSTISNALAGKHHVSDQTRELVRDVAERIGYRASSVARSLRLQQTSMIGVLVADISNPAFPTFVRGVEDVITAAGCDILLCNTDGDEQRQITQMKALLGRNVDGMILISQHCRSHAVRDLLDSGPPFVLVQRRSTRYADDYVGVDNIISMAAAVGELAQLGHHRIGFIRGPAESSTAAERLDGFRRAIQSRHLDTDPALIYEGDYSVDCGYRAALRFLDSLVPPTAIIASNDMNALGVLDAAAERGVAIPARLSVIGHDNVMFSGFSRISLTTIDLPQRDMGAAAANLLLKKIKRKRNGAPQTITFPTQLVVRGSTGPAMPTAIKARRRVPEHNL